ncbi:hypothetical protein NDI39_27465 [Microcoleus sp. ZQ-A2]|nr:hypothetical protein [Microcoleus sp. FACHB-1]
MRNFTPLKRNCPVCHGARRDCRQNRENNFVHCRADLNVVPQGWKALGQDKWGFEMFIEESSTQQDPEAWRERQQERELIRQREKEELSRGALSQSDRDQAIRRIHRHFGLSSKHRQNLRARGLCDSHIDRLPYFTFHPNQEVPQFTPANLPGVRRSKLAVKESGFTCPIPNIDGLIVGWQNRFDNTESGKYRWPSGEKSAHLPNGELPIGVYRPEFGVKSRAIGHSEGFLKAEIIAQLWGLPTLGAASANFATSHEQWQLSLEKLSTELGTKEVHWFADAGSVKNPTVVQIYQRAWGELTGQGYPVWIVWYGQTEKSIGDADEISQEIRESAKLITIDEYLAIAREHGGIKELPATQDRSISQDEWELKFGLGKQIKERVKRVLKGFKGFGKPPACQPQAKEAPNELFRDSNQRLQIWQDAVLQGYKHVLDNSAPGLGKSHAVGIAIPDAFGAEKLWYVANDHRNPTTGTVETNYTDLTVRHKGLKQDFSRKTPNGNPILRHPRTEEGEEPDTAPNCYRTDLFRVFSEKGYNVEGSKNSPICGTCKLAHLCSQGIGGKYGATFRGDRQQALASDRIRAHADSLPIPGTEEGFDYSNSGLFWDEIGSNLKPIKETRVGLQDFDRTFAELESKAPDLHELLKPQRLALRSLLTGEVKQPYHGFDDAAIRNLLPNLSPENSEELIEIVVEIVEKLRETLTPDLDFLNNDPDSITNDEIQEPGISKSMQRLVNREFKREAHREFFEELKNLPLNWLVPFIRVWTRFERGAFRLEGNQLTIFTHNPKYSDIAASARFNVYLDATITRERLALLLGVDKSEIYVVGQETPNHGNLKLIQVTGMGKLGKNRSKSLEQRVAALRKALEARYPGIVFGDWKSQASQGDGQWFVNLRGSNEFKDAPAMAVVGVPYPNVGYLQVLYQTLTGEYAPLNEETPHEGLQRFIEAHVEAEIEQAAGRLRSHLRPNEQLTFLFVGDYNLSFLGMPVEQVEAFQICPEAGTDAQITRWKILEAVRLLHDQGQKLTQVAIATLIGKSQELVSKIASEFGGWKRLKKILLVLLNPPSSGSNIFSGLTEDEKWLAQIYLPACLDDHSEDAVEQIGQLVQLYGIKQFLRLLSVATPQTQARLLALLLQSLSLPFHTELVALLVGGAS